MLFSAMLYECVTQECPEMLPTYIAIEQVTNTTIHAYTEFCADAVELFNWSSLLTCHCFSICRVITLPTATSKLGNQFKNVNTLEMIWKNVDYVQFVDYKI